MNRSISILWVLVIVSLVLNLGILLGLNIARTTAIQELEQVEAMLEQLSQEVIVYNVPINQPIPMVADVPFQQKLNIPVNTIVPLDQQINLPLQTPAGEINIDVPIKADFPIDVVVPVDFNETLHVDTVVDLDTSVPVEIAIAETPLISYLKEVRLDVARLKNRLALKSDTDLLLDSLDTDFSKTERPAGDNVVLAAEKQEAESETGDQDQPATQAEQPAENPAAETGGEAAVQADDAALQTGPDLCTHPYLPLQVGTAWTYNSPNTSYMQRVENNANHQAQLSSKYEGRDLKYTLVCDGEGLGGSFLGDMRRLSEFGDLSFRNPRGQFLPQADFMETVGNSWTQEYDVGGRIEATQGDQSLQGEVTQGKAVAVYTVAGQETLATPLGDRDALRIEQKLTIDLTADFDLGDEAISANEAIAVTNIYWFVRDLGLAKLHWQGGSIERSWQEENEDSSETLTIDTLPEDQLVFVCLLFEGNTFECKQAAGVSQLALSQPAASELEVAKLVFPESVGDITEFTGNASENNSAASQSGSQAEESAEETYFAAVARLGGDLMAAANEFGDSVAKFRNDEISLDQFEQSFRSFSPKARSIMGSINQLTPPQEAATAHQKLVGGLTKCDQAIDLLDNWLETFDDTSKNAGALLVAQCLQDLTTAQQELSDLAQ